MMLRRPSKSLLQIPLSLSGALGKAITTLIRWSALMEDFWRIPDGYRRRRRRGIYVEDRTTRAIERISGGRPAITPDGRFVAFASGASDLTPGDTNGLTDVFVYDRQLRTTRRVSVDSAGKQGNDHVGNGTPSISANGSFVAFDSIANNLVAGDTNGAFDVFVRARGHQPDGRNDLLVDFGARGLWEFLNNRAWTKIRSASPSLIAVGDLDGSLKDEAIASFSRPGLEARYNNTGAWVVLTNAVPARFIAGDLDGNGSDELITAFTGGLRARYNNAGPWKLLQAGPTQDLAIGDLNGNGKDDLIVDRGSGGLWAYYDNATWFKLRVGSPSHIGTGDLDGDSKDEVIADYGNAGLLVRYNNAGNWAPIRNGPTQGIASGDLNGNGKVDVLADLGANGLWAYYDNAAPWVKLAARSPVFLLATDLDRNGKDDVVADFGSTGLWVRKNDKGAFQQLRALPSQGMVAGAFD